MYLKKETVIILSVLFLIVPVFAEWKYNPFTDALDYYTNVSVLINTTYNTTYNDSYMLTTGDTAIGNYTFGDNAFHIDSANKMVSIGTSNPTHDFEIRDDEGFATMGIIAPPGNASFFDFSNTSVVLGRLLYNGAAADTHKYFGFVNYAAIGGLRFVNQERVTSFYHQTNSSEYNMSFYTKNGLVVNPWDIERLRITNKINQSDIMMMDSDLIVTNGKVGINEKEPLNELYVLGDLNVTGDINYGGSLVSYSPLVLGDDICIKDHILNKWVSCGASNLDFTCWEDSYCEKKGSIMDDKKTDPDSYIRCEDVVTTIEELEGKRQVTKTICKPIIISHGNVDYYYNILMQKKMGEMK